MPNLIDVVEVAEALETKSVFVAADRCVVVRNRNVKCRKCQEACPTDAFLIQGNTVELNNKACVGCGSCTTVCPTEALLPLRPLDEELAHTIADTTLNNEKRSVFACARIASKGFADSEKFAEVPCLARMEESILVELVAQGVEELILVDGDCSTCKYRHCDSAITATVESVNTLIAAMGSTVSLVRQTGFPEDMRADGRTGVYGVDRRGFFSRTRETAKDAVGKTVVTVINSKMDPKVQSLRERLGISAKGTLPYFDPRRRMHLLDSMDAIGAPSAESIETRLWGRVEVDTSLCSACNMCTVFCPTGALKKVELDSPNEAGSTEVLEFSMADCVQCRTCQDICLKKCLQVESVIELSELFDFEPRQIPLPPAPKKNSLLGNLKR